MFSKNVGSMDRAVRGLVGIILIALAAMGTIPGGLWAVIAYIVGAVMLFTAAVGWCPPYSLLGINTCSVKK